MLEYKMQRAIHVLDSLIVDILGEIYLEAWIRKDYLMCDLIRIETRKILESHDK